MDDSETYAPQSPDLTATSVPDQFEPHPQHREYRGSVSLTPFTPTSEVQTPFAFPPPAQSGYHPHPQPQPQLQQYAPPQVHSQQAYYHIQQQGQPLAPVYSPQATGYNPYFTGAAAVPPPPSAQYGTPQQPFAPHYQFPGPPLKQEDSYGSHDTKPMAPGRGKKSKKEEDVEVENNAPGVREGIEVRTKFPVARIKRIMQADEDVGKVAQVTPVAVSKALELFMISLVTKAAAQAKERGSKRVLAAHLKQAVLEDDQFDYLQEIVSKVAEAPAKNADKQEDSDEAMEGSAPPKRKRAAGGGRKKRKDSDEF